MAASGPPRRAALPKPPTRISEKLLAYKSHGAVKSRFDRRAAAAAARGTVAARARPPADGRQAAGGTATAGPAASPARGSTAVEIPRLTALALRAIAANFESNPRIEGLAPEYSLAITSSLPLDLDVGVTGPHVHDEHYWKRAALEHKHWRNCRIEDHGLSWKQLYLERHLQDSLEAFGVFPGISPEHEQAQVRPPIDASHPLWRELYPDVGNDPDTPLEVAAAAPGYPVDPQGRPLRERFCRNGVNCDGVRIARAANCGWVALERLKEFVVPAVEEFEGSFAWSGLPKEEAWPPAAGAAAGGEGASEAGTADPASVAAATAVAAAKDAMGAVAAALQGGGDAGADLGDGGELEAECDANTLKEFLSPSEVAEFLLTGRWPRQRRPCVICLRAEQLSRLVLHMEAAEDVAFSLRLRQLPSHLDLEIPFSRLPNLSELELSYGIARVGMTFDRALLGMKVTDAMSLAKCAKATQTLTSLALQANLINDKVLAALMEGLAENRTVTHLDLSHNEITAKGVRLLCKSLGPDAVLMSLDLSDNQIHSDGGKYLGRMLRRNLSLVDLSMRLNALDERGARLLMEGVRRSESLTALNLASNEVCGDGVTALAECLRDADSALVAVDLSNNALDEGDAATLAAALRDNCTLTSCDLRSNPRLPPDSEAGEAIRTVCRRNELALRTL
ncbi:hypothetical protein FNF28_02629 [Cafeteria roenbergensis]|uniref:Uncharacterized protein n=1 Tax=Cafeteria roenbergensis TaxID=33653 RepID=A0A5A8DWX4_CAFRO|nr:hypothetical protein FNF28_02629 [Cafeteria roenbergensis]